jgi:hypothetical protein
MSQDCPDTDALHAVWRLKLAQAERRYAESGTTENRAGFLKVLRIFTALVMRGVIPRNDDIATW